MAERPGDPEALGRVAANETVLGWLADGAEPGTPGDPYALDDYLVHTHPDLTERLAELAPDPGRDGPVGVFGVAALVRDGIVRVVARGTSRLWLRVDDPAGRATIVAAGGRPEPELGPQWLSVDAWQTELPRAEGTDLLRAWVARAVGQTGRSDA